MCNAASSSSQNIIQHPKSSKKILRRRQDQTVEDDSDTFTLVVVRCNVNLTWIDQVPQDWRIIVYEKCDDKPSTNYSVFTAHRVGSDECNGYLDYLVDYYDDLTSITVFMQDDGLWPWSKSKREAAHTPFSDFPNIVQSLKLYMPKNQTFLHFGVSDLTQAWYGDPYSVLGMRTIWPYLKSLEVPLPPATITTKPSANIAVRREQIQARSRSIYEALLYQLRYINEVQDIPGLEDAVSLDNRRLCCALERTWHILFGQPAILPENTKLSELVQNAGLVPDFWNGTHFLP
jgi:hypothetical protein